MPGGVLGVGAQDTLLMRFQGTDRQTRAHT